MYIFDSNTIIEMGTIYPDRFPTFWRQINQYVADGKIVSVREVYREVLNSNEKSQLEQWVESNKSIFRTATQEEAMFIAEIFKIKNFKDIVRKKQVLTGTPVAAPFVIAAAKIHNACVVTQESFRPNSAKIPNICNHFGIPCVNLQGFMERENWVF